MGPHAIPPRGEGPFDGRFVSRFFEGSQCYRALAAAVPTRRLRCSLVKRMAIEPSPTHRHEADLSKGAEAALDRH
jgi:hypothetical protein